MHIGIHCGNARDDTHTHKANIHWLLRARMAREKNPPYKLSTSVLNGLTTHGIK